MPGRRGDPRVSALPPVVGVVDRLGTRAPGDRDVEPGDRDAQTMRTLDRTAVEIAVTTERPEPTVSDRHLLERLWLATTMLGLALIVFAQSAGNAAADTKLDLVVSPLRFLRRALHLWDPIGNAGQLQNQAYGYLFPIGPFYSGLHATGMQPWVMQRAFESVIVCAAFLGTCRLARRMGVDRFGPALGAGLAYALA